MDCADFILFFSDTKKVTNAKVLEFFPGDIGWQIYLATIGAKAQTTLRLFSPLHFLIVAKVSRSLPMSRASRLNCLHESFRFISTGRCYILSNTPARLTIPYPIQSIHPSIHTLINNITDGGSNAPSYKWTGWTAGLDPAKKASPTCGAYNYSTKVMPPSMAC